MSLKNPRKKAAVMATDENGYMGVRYSNMVGILIEAIKELKADFEAYKKTHP